MIESDKYSGINGGATGNLKLGRGLITILKGGGEALTEKMPFEQLLEGGERGALQILEGRACQAEVTASVRALKQEHSRGQVERVRMGGGAESSEPGGTRRVGGECTETSWPL